MVQTGRSVRHGTDTTHRQVGKQEEVVMRIGLDLVGVFLHYVANNEDKLRKIMFDLCLPCYLSVHVICKHLSNVRIY